ncbi:MAG: PfkB family carbohydrate kinase [bacterium]|jgi:rfaE bifunctional protein kinase chain/domain
MESTKKINNILIEGNQKETMLKNKYTIQQENKIEYFDKFFYKEIINEFKKFIDFIKFKKILVIGDLMIDRWIKGEVERISPEAPVPVVKVFKEWIELGGAANVAKIISYYSSYVYLVGFAGNDIYFKNLTSLLKKRKINYNIIKTNKTTIVKTRVIAHNNQHIVRVDRENTNYDYNDYSNLFINLKKINFNDFDIIFFIDYNKNLFNKDTINFIFENFNKYFNDKFIIICPKPSNFNYFSIFNKIDSLSVNKKEAKEIFNNSFFINKFSIDLIKDFLYNNNLSKNLTNYINDLVITLGSWGLSVFNKDFNLWIDAIKQDVFDVVGAGDNVASIYGLFKYYSNDLLKSAFLANLAGSIAVSKPFTNPVKPIDISHSLIYLFKINYKNKFLKIRNLK